jgi:hypothetical protein
MLIAYWVMLPIWLRIIEGYSEPEHATSLGPLPGDILQQTRDFHEEECGQPPQQR